MTIFELGVKILLILSFLFFLIFAFFCRSWAKPMHPERCTIIGIFVSFLYTFWFLIGGFLLLILILIISLILS